MRRRTPTILQMEATECGAASLGMVLAYHGRFEPLERLREECGVSRDGSNAGNILRAGRRLGLEGKGYRKEVDKLIEQQSELCPAIIHWNFNHFVVLEGFGWSGFGPRRRRVAHLNDPGRGRVTVDMDTFDASFTGVTLALKPSEGFERGGRRPSTIAGFRERLRGSESAAAFLVLAALGLVVPGLILPTLSKVFVDDVLLADKNDWLRPLLFGMALTAVVRAALTWLQQSALVELYSKLTTVGSTRFIWHVLHLPVPFFLARYSGDIGDRVGLNDKIASVLSGRLGQTGLDLMMVLFYGALLLLYDVTLALIGFSIAALNLGALRVVDASRKEGSQRLRQQMGKLAGVEVGGLQLIESIKAGGTETDFFARWAGHFAVIQNEGQALGRTTLSLNAVPPFLNAVNQAAILTVGGIKVMNGDLTVGMLVAFQSLMSSFLQPISSLVSLGTTLQESEADVRRLDDVLRYETVPSPPEPEGDEAFEKLEGSVSVRGLEFGYTRLAEPLIRNFDLELGPGRRVALVGGSGSGKSTIARLVAGLFEPWSGDICFDRIPRSQLSRRQLSSSISMVDQSVFLFRGTVRDNLTMWDPTAPQEDVIRAAKDAHIHDVIVSRPGGYDSIVEEGGRNFSGGQRQRLEIARALVGNPSVLLLDEATSALDPKTEHIIDDNLRRRGCTCIMVAHRLSTIRDADEIILLDHGCVVERGTHDSLMATGRRYADLMGAS